MLVVKRAPFKFCWHNGEKQRLFEVESISENGKVIRSGEYSETQLNDLAGMIERESELYNQHDTDVVNTIREALANDDD